MDSTSGNTASSFYHLFPEDLIFAGGILREEPVVDIVKLLVLKLFQAKCPASSCSLYEWEGFAVVGVPGAACGVGCGCISPSFPVLLWLALNFLVLLFAVSFGVCAPFWGSFGCAFGSVYGARGVYLGGFWSNIKEVVKDLAEIFYKKFIILAAMVAVKCTHVGEKFFTQHYIIYSASVYMIMAYFLVWVLQTLLQQPIPNSGLFPISLLLSLGCAVSFLALTLISLNIAVINLVLWVFTFILVIFNNYYQQKLTKSVSV
ncbi:transmembrane protein, putative [Medicago truncatula]|uniref:Transmembrane protein, putative n=1 Tax=Medicago truncatula TaxID=3880 RepID=G7LDE1_MEDTR|nr:transmembrane protein, putative [Medicago truncatula]